MRSSSTRGPLGLARQASACGVLLLYVAGLNPWFLPDQFDDVVYFEGAREIASHACFCFHGLAIGSWGPVLPLVLAGPIALGLDSVFVAKAMVVLFVAAALALCFRFMQRERRPRPLATTILFALAPTPFLSGTRIMSEWPFMAVSLVFLWLLEDLRGPRRGRRLAMVAGLVLAIAVLTRFAGVLLGAAVVTQAVWAWRRERRVRAVMPEAITAAIGAAVFVAWRARNAWHTAHGLACVDYDQGLGILAHLDLLATLKAVPDALFHVVRLGGATGLQSSLVLSACIVVAAVVLVGALARWRSRNWSNADSYAVATLLLYSFLEWKVTRYLLPVTPFLISWFFVGVAKVVSAARLATTRAADQWARVAIAIWMATLVAMDVSLLAYGNGRTHRGLSLIASPSADSFYLGYWRDLWNAAQHVRSEPSELPVGLLGRIGNERAVFAFSGRRCVTWPSTERISHLLVVAPAEPTQQDRTRLGLVAEPHGVLTVYRVTRDPIHVDASRAGGAGKW